MPTPSAQPKAKPTRSSIWTYIFGGGIVILIALFIYWVAFVSRMNDGRLQIAVGIIIAFIATCMVILLGVMALVVDKLLSRNNSE